MSRALVLAAFAVVAAVADGFAASTDGDFYRGKVIRIIVGFSAGGGFDTYARTLSRYMGEYISGNPSIIVENMTGAGSLIAANHVYRVAKPDGLTIGAFNGNQMLGQLIGAQGISFDARKMEWMGAFVRAQPKSRYCQRRPMAGFQNTSEIGWKRSRHADGRRAEDFEGSHRPAHAADKRL
jgi:tripartite-type tricarboxylate transporter receptor subunit TctC